MLTRGGLSGDRKYDLINSKDLSSVEIAQSYQPKGTCSPAIQVALKVRSIPRSVKRVIRTYLEILTTVNRQKSAEVIVIAEMSDEGPNPCDCEMQQLPLRLRTQQSRKQRTPTILDQCRNCEKKWRSLAVSCRNKVTVPALVEGMHLLMNQRTEVRIKHMETAGCVNCMSDAVWQEGETPSYPIGGRLFKKVKNF